jgi:hypothetical protein
MPAKPDDDAAMGKNSNKDANRPRRDGSRPDDHKARLAEALRANLKRRKDAGLKSRKPEDRNPDPKV